MFVFWLSLFRINKKRQNAHFWYFFNRSIFSPSSPTVSPSIHNLWAHIFWASFSNGCGGDGLARNLNLDGGLHILQPPQQGQIFVVDSPRFAFSVDFGMIISGDRRKFTVWSAPKFHRRRRRVFWTCWHVRDARSSRRYGNCRRWSPPLPRQFL